MNKLVKFITSARSKTKLLITTVIALTAITGGVVLAGYGPDRRVFDYNVPADRGGSLIGPVFNSFINTGVYGDERSFVDAKDASITTGGGYADQVPVEPGKEYVVRLYVHNNANMDTNCLESQKVNGQCTTVDPNAVGVAKNVRVRVNILGGLANGHGIGGYITSDNGIDRDGNPMRQVYDTVDLRNATKAFGVEYVPGSALIYNQVNQNGAPLSDSIVTAAGAPIGYDQMNGIVPGCFEFSAYVTVKVKVVAPEIKITKQVRKAGTTEWLENVDAKPGETVQWLVKVINTGTAVQNNVVASDLIPPHLKYVPDTAKWFSGEQSNVAYDFNQFISNNGNGGYNFGNYAPNGGGFLVRFDTKVEGDFTECTVNMRNVARVKSDQQPELLIDTADVRITRENCQPPVEMCPIPGKTHLPKNSPECKQPPVVTTTRTTLPDTGAGSVLGIFAATSAVGTIAHRLFWTRRFGR